jgi:hypothetical protein
MKPIPFFIIFVQYLKTLTMKVFRLKLSFRFFAILDIMFAERFELKTYRNVRKTSETNFCKKEIDDAGRNGLL